MSYADGPVLVGTDLAYDVWVTMANGALVTNTHTEIVTEELYQSQQTLDAAAAAYLLGDIHAAVPTAILDGDFDFLAAQLGQARGGAQIIGQAHDPVPLAFAPHKPALPALDAAASAVASTEAFVAPVWTAWLDGSFGHSALAATADHFGLSFTTADTALGVDFADGPWRAGGSVGYDRTGFSQTGTSDTGMVTSVRAGAYVRFDPGAWSITGGLSAGYHWLQLTRLSGLPAPTTAEYGATSFSAGVEAARRFNLYEADFEPFAGGILSLANTGGFTESGTSLLEVSGQPAATGTLNFYLGARVTGRHELASGMVVKPEVHGRVVVDVIGDRRALTTSLAGDPGGAPMLITGLQPGRIAAQLGAGIEFEMSAAWRFGLAYELQLRAGGVAHQLSGSAGAKW